MLLKRKWTSKDIKRGDLSTICIDRSHLYLKTLTFIIIFEKKKNFKPILTYYKRCRFNEYLSSFRNFSLHWSYLLAFFVRIKFQFLECLLGLRRTDRWEHGLFLEYFALKSSDLCCMPFVIHHFFEKKIPILFC